MAEWPAPPSWEQLIAQLTADDKRRLLGDLYDALPDGLRTRLDSEREGEL